MEHVDASNGFIEAKFFSSILKSELFSLNFIIQLKELK